MEIKLNVSIKKTETKIQIGDNQGTIEIMQGNNKMKVDQKAVFLLLLNNQIVEILSIVSKELIGTVDFDKVIAIVPSWDFELEYLEKALIDEAVEKGLEIQNRKPQDSAIPESAKKSVGKYKELIITILDTFGYNFNTKEKLAKAKPAKTQHRWRKEVSHIEFFVDTRESKATVLWQKRNEMLLKAGAKIMRIAPLNKDGSIGFAAKMGDKIRLDHQDKIKNFVTMEDIVFKSVNEIGIFLYFAGTNSWLELLDEDGKSIDEWTRVE